MDNISNPIFDWTIHPASNIPLTITGTINSTTTATTTTIVKSDIPTEYHTTILHLSIKTFSNISIKFRTITNIPYIITNHQIFPTQQSLLALEYSIFVATAYKIFDPGGITSSK
jgi:hypothetical protein